MQPDPRTRRGISLSACVLLGLVAACSSVPPSRSGESSQAAAASASASAVAPPDAATSSEDPAAACRGVEPEGDPVEIAVSAASGAFDTQTIEGPRECQPFVIEFTNMEAHEHNIFIRLDAVLGDLAFEGETVGRTTIRYEVPGLPAGTHYFYCSLHAAAMKGELIVTSADS